MVRSITLGSQDDSLSPHLLKNIVYVPPHVYVGQT